MNTPTEEPIISEYSQEKQAFRFTYMGKTRLFPFADLATKDSIADARTAVREWLEEVRAEKACAQGGYA